MRFENGGVPHVWAGCGLRVHADRFDRLEGRDEGDWEIGDCNHEQRGSSVCCRWWQQHTIFLVSLSCWIRQLIRRFVGPDRDKPALFFHYLVNTVAPLSVRHRQGHFLLPIPIPIPSPCLYPSNLCVCVCIFSFEKKPPPSLPPFNPTQQPKHSLPLLSLEPRNTQVLETKKKNH